jgi:uncharacterized membrane protein YbhN (UPF0104 family)
VNNLLGVLFAILWIACVAIFLLSGFEQRRLLARLREHHLNRWIELGLPTAFSIGGPIPRMNSPESRFILDRLYLALPDPELHQLGNRARFMAQCSLAAFFFLVIAGCVIALVG